MEKLQVGSVHPHELLRAVAINEDIKSVMRIANEINLSAINAMLVSNKIGKASSGFGVVSTELRAFSRRLSETMYLLLAYVSDLVRELAGVIRRNKALKLQKAAQAGAAHGVHWDRGIARKLSELAQSHELIGHCRQKLALAVSRANKLCIMGQSLTYAAKIESVYGGEQARALKHVSEHVEKCISEILATLSKQEMAA